MKLMAITKPIPLLQPPASPSIFHNLQFPSRSLHIRSRSSHFLSTFFTPTSAFQGSSLFIVSPIISRRSFPKFLSTTYSLPGETATATKVDVVDSSLAVKKRAADISSELKGTSIFLVGMKSSLKTSLGKLLADVLRYYFFDSDSLVEEVAGGAFALKFFRETDEKGFLQSETEVLKQLSLMGRLVACAGDGAVQSSTNLALLRHGISLWIDVPLDMLARRAGEDHTPESETASGSHSEVLTQLIATYEEMKGGYATADATISLQKICARLGYDELDLVTTEDMALEVLKELEKLTRVKKQQDHYNKSQQFSVLITL